MNTTSLDQLLATADALIATGQTDQGVAAYQQAIDRNPRHAETYNRVGAALHKLDRLDPAIACYVKALELQPTLVSAGFNLSIALRQQNRLDQAIDILQQTLKLCPGHAEGFHDLGSLLQLQNRLDEAIAVYRQALAAKPQFALAWLNLARALDQQREYPEAIAACRRALAVQPDLLEAYTILGNALADSDRPGEGLDAHQKVLDAHPQSAAAHCNCGPALWKLARFDEAAGCYRRAVELDPEHALAHYNLASVLLLKGELRQGWREYEWRKRIPGLVKMCSGFGVPEWDGGELHERRILLHTEQGYGDAIQFIRYVSLVQGRNPSRIIVLCQPELRRLFERLEPPVKIVTHDDPPVTDFDLHCPLMSLPHRFATTLATIPAPIPYLRADPELSSQWRERLADSNALKIGIAWAGRPDHWNERHRSVPLSTFAPLKQVKNLKFISLQKSAAASQIRNTAFNVIDWTGELSDFADTAALIDNLDLVITVDTAIAHLACAMGKPAWVLISWIPDWRWMLDRTDSPWYPTMRLFRQTKAGDWQTPIEQIVEAVQAFKQ